MNICFLEKTSFEYNSENLYSNKLRGAESILINLSKALVNNGHNVTILNNCPRNEILDKIQWININSYTGNQIFDLTFSNNDTRLFDKIKSKKKILISHSLQSIEKFIRKKQLIGYLKHKPKILLLSDYHQKKRSKLLTLFGSIRLNWAVDDIFIKTNINEKKQRNRAIFTSSPDRNLEILLKIWNNLIHPRLSTCELMIPKTKIDLNKNNVISRERGSQKLLIDDLLSSKVFLIPGHKAELFCLAAEEAKELCIPIITLGIGCLAERVEHGLTGFIAKNEKEFADYTIKLFNDENLYKQMRENLIGIRGQNDWKKTAKKLIELIA